MPEPESSSKVAEKLVGFYFTLIAILIGVLGIVGGRAKLEAGSSYYEGRIFLVIVASLICIAAAAAVLAFLTYVGRLNTPKLNVGLFIFLMLAVFLAIIIWSLRVLI